MKIHQDTTTIQACDAVTHIAFLRGINFWGNKKVEMSKLKELFEFLWFFDISTYMNSGNVIFSSKNMESTPITQIIETAIIKNFWFEVRVLVLTDKTLCDIYQSIPTAWNNEKWMLPHIAFLWNEVDHPNILDRVDIDWNTIVQYVKGAILWNVELKNWSRDTIYRFVTGKISQHVTVRSINTVRKLITRLNK